MPECKHEAISQQLMEELTAREYKERFPTVRELAARFGVSTRTMTKALKPLIQQGLIVPDGPRGCRVPPAMPRRPRSGIVGIFAGIGKIVPDEDPLLKPLLECVKRDGFTPLLTDVPSTDMIRNSEYWRSSYLDGYIFVYSSINLHLTKLLQSEGIPFVAANRLPESYGGHWVDFDHYPALLAMTRALRKKGRRRIALLDKPSFSNTIAYTTEIWDRVQRELAIPPEECCGTFGVPVASEDYAVTLCRELEGMAVNGGMPDTVLCWSRRAGNVLQPLLKKMGGEIELAAGYEYLSSRQSYTQIAESVWQLFQKVLEGSAQAGEFCEVPYQLDMPGL